MQVLLHDFHTRLATKKKEENISEVKIIQRPGKKFFFPGKKILQGKNPKNYIREFVIG